MQNTKKSRVSDEGKTQNFIVKIQKIALWWHYAWLGIIISIVVYHLELISLTRLASVIIFIIIAVFSYKAYQTLDYLWTNAALATLSFGVVGAIYLGKLMQVLATGLILLIVLCICFIIWAFAAMVLSLYAKGPSSTS